MAAPDVHFRDRVLGHRRTLVLTGCDEMMGITAARALPVLCRSIFRPPSLAAFSALPLERYLFYTERHK
jgi:hypothetical protein